MKDKYQIQLRNVDTGKIVTLTADENYTIVLPRDNWETVGGTLEVPPGYRIVGIGNISIS